MEASAVVLDRRFAKQLDLASVGTKMHLTSPTGEVGTWSIQPQLPDEDDLRAVAGPLRDIVMAPSTAVSMGAVLNSLHRCVRDQEALDTRVKPLQEAWKAFRKMKYFSANGWTSRTEGQVELLSDREIAEHWLYSDQLHFDLDRRAQLRLFDEGTKLQAAALWAKDACILVRAVRVCIIDLDERRLIQAPD